MSERSKISWCDDTLNPWRGCDKVSPGCAHCYITNTAPFRSTGMKHGDPRVLSENAFKLAHRLNRKPWVCDKCGKGFPAQQAHFCLRDEATFYSDETPWHVREIFSLSLGDWLDPKIDSSPGVGIGALVRWLDTIRVCDSVHWLLLSKRIELFAERLMKAHAHVLTTSGVGELSSWIYRWVNGHSIPQHIAIGTSVEDRRRRNRIDLLQKIPAHRRFISFEPLLEDAGSLHPIDGIHQIILGGESGPKARPCNVEWIRSLVQQGQAAGVRVFVKQLGKMAYEWDFVEGAFHPDNPVKMPVLMSPYDKKGADQNVWPADLRVQERIIW